jgi:hypothetical protein
MSDTLVAQGFNYSALPTDVADTARAAADRIKGRHQRQMAAVIETGRDLRAMKELLEHGQFLEWVHAEFAWTDRTAENYMRAATEFSDKIEIISNLPLTEVYRLASPSTPPSVRDAVVARLETGEHIEPAEVRELVRDAKEDARRVEAEAQLSPQQRKTKAQRQAKRQAKEEREWQEHRTRREACEQATAELVDFIAGQLGPALPDVLRQIKVAKSQGAYLVEVIRMLQERATDE